MSNDPGPPVIVLDDDPTGTQTVADLPIVLSADRETLARAARRRIGPVWVLTNTRAMTEERARLTLGQVARDVRSAFGQTAFLVLRGDSTLRGHVLAEIDTLSSPGSVALFVPAFVEQGRVTIDGIHYATKDGQRVEVASTEYARDPQFSYRSSRLTDWIAERAPGRPAFGMSATILRGDGARALADLLCDAPDGAVVVPDAETVADLRVIRDGWLKAQRRGRQVVLRCAASLATVVTGAAGRAVTLAPVTGPVLVVCASYSSGATEQLAAMAGRDDMASHEFDLAYAQHPDSSGYCRTLASAAADSLARRRVVVLSTPRDVRPDAMTFAAGEAIMDSVVATVRLLRGRFAALVTKGGITSARVARDALSVPIAYVRGQVLPGIPAWELCYPPGSGIGQVIVPGNVGQPSAINQIVNQLTGSGSPPCAR